MIPKKIEPYPRPIIVISDITELSVRQLWEASRSQKELEKSSTSNNIQHRKAS